MEMQRSGNIVTVKGNIKSIQDYEQLKAELDSMRHSYNNITLNFEDAIAVTSSVIGYLTKLSNEGIRINLNVGKELYNLFKELNLLSTFNIRQI